MVKKESIIREYYKLIDDNKIDEVLDLFSKDIIYLRAKKEIKGFKKLKFFYKKVRKLKGKHKINKIIKKENLIIIIGSFNGTNGLKKRIKFNFMDVFKFNNKNKIKRRETYLKEDFNIIK